MHACCGSCFGGLCCGSRQGLYYTETGFGDTLSRLNVDGDITTATNDTLRFNRFSDPRALAVDHTNYLIYFANGNAIYRTDFNGSFQTLVTATSGAPGDIEIDSANGTLYYSTLFTGASEAIWSVNTDGTSNGILFDAGTIATTNPGEPTKTTQDVSNISLDLDNSLIYWTSDNGANAGRIALNSAPIGGGG